MAGQGRRKLTEEEKAFKEMEKQKKAELKEQEINNCILKECYGFSKTEINKFIDLCKKTNASQWEVVRLGINAILSGQVDYRVKTTTVLELKEK